MAKRKYTKKSTPKTTSQVVTSEIVVQPESIEEAPKVAIKQTPITGVKFRGKGLYYPVKKDGTRVMFKFDKSNKFTAIAKDEEEIAWCEKRGFERV